jgi:hypothetical protein
MNGEWGIVGTILTNILGEGPVPAPLYSTQITNGPYWDQTRSSNVWFMLCRNTVTNYSKDDSESISTSTIFGSNVTFRNTSLLITALLYELVIGVEVTSGDRPIATTNVYLWN